MDDTDYTNERWESIEGFPSYVISDHGRVKRAVTNGRWKKGQFIRSAINRKGYVMHSLCENAVRHNKRLARLVIEAFVGKRPFPNYECAHNDGDKRNNHFENLRWATHKDNINDKWLHGTMLLGNKCNGAKLTELQVIDMRQSLEPAHDLASRLGVSVHTVKLIRKRKSWVHI